MHGWYDSNEFLSIRWQVDWQGGEWSIQDSKDRATYYGTGGTPDVWFQGTLRHYGAPTSVISGLPYRESYLALKGPSPFLLEVRNFDPNTGSVEIYLEVVSDPGSVSGMIVKTVVLEDNMRDASNQMHENIARDALADEVVTAASVGQSQTFTRTFAVGPTWKKPDLKVVAFVQHTPSKKILQAAASTAKPQYSLTYYFEGDAFMYTPPGSPVSFGDFHAFNAGTVSDTFTFKVIQDRGPAGWTVELSDGVTTYPNEAQIPLNPGEEAVYHPVVTPTTPGYAIFRVQMSPNGQPALVREITFRVLTNGLPILVVDDDGGADYESYYIDALDDGAYNFGVWPLSQAALPGATLNEFPVVVWNVGWSSPTLTAQERTDIGNFLDNGGKLFISGQDLGWDLNASTNSNASTISWFETYLHGKYISDNPANDPNNPAPAADRVIYQSPGDPIGDSLGFNLDNRLGGDGADNQDWPDVISPQPDGDTTSVFYYRGFKSAGIKSDTGTYMLVYLGFGFEGIEFAADRAEVMKRVLDWFGISAGDCLAGRVSSLKIEKNGTNLDFSWIDDSMALGGFNLYNTVDPLEIPNLNLDGGHLPDQNVSSPAVTVPNDTVIGPPTFYQIVAACDATTEGPN